MFGLEINKLENSVGKISIKRLKKIAEDNKEKKLPDPKYYTFWLQRDSEDIENDNKSYEFQELMPNYIVRQRSVPQNRENIRRGDKKNNIFKIQKSNF